MIRRVAIATLLTGALAVATPLAANAGTSTISPHLTCPSGYTQWHVKGADWLKVHTAAGTNPDNVVGQIPRGNPVCLKDSDLTSKYVNNQYWDYGYGYNGSVKVTGWMSDTYIGV